VMHSEYGSGVGRSKKEAEQKAASAAYKALEAAEVLGSAGKSSV
jgi:ribonuclease III